MQNHSTTQVLVQRPLSTFIHSQSATSSSPSPRSYRNPVPRICSLNAESNSADSAGEKCRRRLHPLLPHHAFRTEKQFCFSFTFYPSTVSKMIFTEKELKKIVVDPYLETADTNVEKRSETRRHVFPFSSAESTCTRYRFTG